jgi:hypothetical protein
MGRWGPGIRGGAMADMGRADGKKWDEEREIRKLQPRMTVDLDLAKIIRHD